MRTLFTILLSFLVLSSCSEDDQPSLTDQHENSLLGVWKKTPESGDTIYFSGEDNIDGMFIFSQINESYRSFSSNGIMLTWTSTIRSSDSSMLEDWVLLSNPISSSFYTEGNYLFYEFGSETTFDDPTILEYNVQDNVLTINSLSGNITTTTYERQ